MNQPGGDNLLVQARSALLDALHALHDHRDALIVIGAQAVYLRSGARRRRVGRVDEGQRPRRQPARPQR